VAGARAGERGRLGRVVEAVVLVRDQHRDRRADRPHHAHAGEELGAVGLDLLPPAAAVAALAAREFAVDHVGVDLHAGGEAFDERDECFAVRFAGGAIAERGHGDSWCERGRVA
jgi:hypothetical protein